MSFPDHTVLPPPLPSPGPCHSGELAAPGAETFPALQHPESEAQLPPTAAHLNGLGAAPRTGDGPQTEPPAQGRTHSPSCSTLHALALGTHHKTADHGTPGCPSDPFASR